MEKKSIKKLLVLAIVSLFLMGMAVASYAATTCPSGAICRPETPGSYTGNGPYGSASYSLPGYTAGATVYYPTSATAPFSGLVFCPPYTGSQYMYQAWGPFFASHGIVMVTMDTTTTMDSVNSRATQQLNVVNILKRENTRNATTLRPNPLKGKLNINRIGVTGWSMGGGATWINSAQTGIKTAMSLAGHNATATGTAATGRSTKCPTLLMNGALDTTILGGLGQSEGVYSSIPAGIAKVIYVVSTAGHMDWGSPTSASNGSARIALAFQKTFLDGDTRWVGYIARPSDASTWNTANLPQ